MAASLNVSVTLSDGDTAVQGGVAARVPLNFVLAYTEKSQKIVHVPPSTVDQAITFDSVGAPKFLFMRSLDIDVTVKYGDGTTTVTSGLAGGGGWMMVANPNGQAINRVLVSTPATPSGGAHVEILACE